jgi:endonuclease/exonuclease/phosphatase family metal-dependent hydrolase
MRYCWALIFALFFSVSSWAAESQIWVRNHTQHAVHVETTVAPDTRWVEGQDWRRGDATIQPGEVGEVVRFSRRKRDLKSPKTWLVNTFRTEGVEEKLELRTVVKRSFCSTSMQSGLGGMSSSEVRWGPDDQALSVRRKMQQRDLGGVPFCQGGDERIEVLIESSQKPPVPRRSGPDDLHILTYNIWYLMGKPRQSTRWKGIVDVVSGHDVVVFSEAFKERYRDLIIDRIREEYPYITRVISGGSLINGGVFVASRWPFEGLEADDSGLYSAPQYIFPGQACAGEDCWAAKGVQYVTVKKNGKRYHLFATHLQSTEPLFRSQKKAFEAMMLQTESVGRWIRSRGIPEEEPVFIAGDLNFDGNNERVARQALKNLSGVMPTWTGGPRHTFMMSNPKSPKLALDHVLFSEHHLRPVSSEQVTLLPGGMLSDHFPVRVLYRFGEP